MTVLVTGAGGQVGQALQAVLAREGWPARARTRAALDIADPAALRAAVAGAEAVVNLAAYTAVDRTEAEPHAADLVNRQGAGHVAAAAAEAGIPVLHLSTDFVFGGGAAEDGPRRPLREDDPPRPANAYGATKLAGEAAVLAACPQAVVLRTAWIFSAHGRNFVRTILRAAAERDELRVVADQVGSPTAAADIAAAILAVLRRLRAGQPVRYGIYHFAGAPPASWHDLAAAAVAAAGLACKVTPIATADWPTPARRPAWSALDGSRFAADFGIVPPDWRIALRDTVAALGTERRDSVRSV